MKGWIKMHREIMQWEWYTDSNTARLFFHLLLLANHQDGKYQGKDIKAGQLITGRKSLSHQLGISEQSIRTSLSKLKSTNEITIKSSNKNSLITIVNWDIYQVDKSYQPANQPTTNQQLTTNKNDKKEKNTTNVVADDEKSLSRFGIYHTIDEAIDAMKSDQIWKAMYGKQAGVTSLNDCDYWIDKYRDHAIASGKMSTSAKELKSHCLNWTRKRIQAGDTAPKVMTPEEKRETRSKRFMTN